MSDDFEDDDGRKVAMMKTAVKVEKSLPSLGTSRRTQGYCSILVTLAATW